MNYFILGSHPKLSIKELESVVGSVSVLSESDQVLVTDKIDNNIGQLQDRLAGTIKIGHIIGELKEWDESGAKDLIASYASQAAGKNKISFGVSVYDLGDKKRTKKIEGEIKNIGGSIKKFLKETGRPVRWVSSKEPILSSVIVEQNGLLSSGGEFVLLVAKDKILIGQTESVQDFKAWSARDFGRPYRDAKNGMLPPKLARMMINLSGMNSEGKTLLDPFCGSGTVLMEGMSLGFKKVIGSDKVGQMVEDTRKNLGWFQGKQETESAEIELHVSEAERINNLVQEPVDLIVTEPFLGTPRRSPIEEGEFIGTSKNLMRVYEPSFKTLFDLLKETGKCVVVFPAFKNPDGEFEHLPLEGMLESIGFKIELKEMYQRDNQFIGRDLFVLSK
jgi:tRNA G10  N-methylase Trm11